MPFNINPKCNSLNSLITGLSLAIWIKKQDPSQTTGKEIHRLKVKEQKI
jgi:hypothetical protein